MTKRSSVAAFVMILGAVLTAAGCDDGSESSGARARAKDVALDELAARDALVAVPPGGAAAASAAFDDDDAIDSYATLVPGVARQVEAIFTEDIGAWCVGDTDGFVVDLAEPDALARLETLAGADASVWAWDDLTDPARWRGGTDVEVFMTVDAADAQVDAVRATLEADPDVVAVDHLTKDEALAEFRQLFADQPELIASTSADALPESFRVELAPGTDTDTLRVADLAGVDEVLEPESPKRRATRAVVAEYLLHSPSGVLPATGESEIFMTLDATPAEIEALAARLAADPEIEATEYLDQEDALAEFRRMAPAIEDVRAEDLPASFRIQFPKDADGGAARERYEAMPGVDEVVGGSIPPCDE